VYKKGTAERLALLLDFLTLVFFFVLSFSEKILFFVLSFF